MMGLVAATRRSPALPLLDYIVDSAVAVALALGVLFFGGRHPWAEAGLFTSAILGASAVAVRNLYRRQVRPFTGAEGMFLAGVIITAFQLCLLPEEWISWLSPRVRELLPAWHDPTTRALLGEWKTLSLSPQETRLGLSLWVAYGLLFFTVVYRVETVAHVERYLRFIAIGIVGIVILGLLQYLFSNGKFLWFYQHPFSHTDDAVKATFTNRNHFAELIALGIGPLLWWLLVKSRRTTEACHSPYRGLTPGKGSESDVLRFVILPLVLLGLLLTFSRGGILAALVAAVVTIGVLGSEGVIRGQWLWIMLVSFIVLASAIVIIGPGRVTHRWEGVLKLDWSEIDVSQARTHVWRNSWRAAQDFWLTGSGIGSFSVVHPHYQNTRLSGHYYTHAENGFLQILVEAGVPGLLLLFAGLAITGRWIRLGVFRAKDSRHRIAGAVIAGGLVAFVLHGVVDYVWYNPALAAVVAVFLACLARLAQLGAVSRGPAGETLTTVANRRLDLPKATSPHTCGWLRPAGLVLAVAVALPVELPLALERFRAGFAEIAWHRYLALYRHADMSADLVPEETPVGENTPSSVSDKMPEAAWNDVSKPTAATWQAGEIERLTDEVNTDYEGTSSNFPRPHNDFSVSADKGENEEVSSRELEMLRYLREVVRYDPARSEAYLRLAKGCLRLFHLKQRRAPNPMPLSQIRDAAVNAQFGSREELINWLRAAFGNHVELLEEAQAAALTASRLCPLQAEAYFILGQTAFLRQETEAIVLTWYHQALTVRPNDGDLLFRIGAELALMGCLEEGMTLWKRAYSCGPWYRDRVLRFVIGRVPPDLVDQEIAFVLETFAPDLPSLRFIYRLYRKRYPPESLARLQQAYAYALQTALSLKEITAEERSELWLEAYFLFRDAGRDEEALRCVAEAARANSVNYHARYYLALSLENAGRYAEAEEHLRWCVQRRPGHRALQKRLQELSRKRLEAAQTAERPAARLGLAEQKSASR